jgi:hypothetical protein
VVLHECPPSGQIINRWKTRWVEEEVRLGMEHLKDPSLDVDGFFRRYSGTKEADK